MQTGGRVEHHCVGGGGRSEVRVRTKIGMNDVELWPIFLVKKNWWETLPVDPLILVNEHKLSGQHA